MKNSWINWLFILIILLILTASLVLIPVIGCGSESYENGVLVGKKIVYITVYDYFTKGCPAQF
jgi:hypothetical protein